MKNEQEPACGKCYWQGVCVDMTPCDYYYPIDDEDDDDIIQSYIEKERLEFYKEWAKYIKDFE